MSILKVKYYLLFFAIINSKINIHGFGWVHTGNCTKCPLPLLQYANIYVHFYSHCKFHSHFINYFLPSGLWRSKTGCFFSEAYIRFFQLCRLRKEERWFFNFSFDRTAVNNYVLWSSLPWGRVWCEGGHGKHVLLKYALADCHLKLKNEEKIATNKKYLIKILQ